MRTQRALQKRMRAYSVCLCYFYLFSFFLFFRTQCALHTRMRAYSVCLFDFFWPFSFAAQKEEIQTNYENKKSPYADVCRRLLTYADVCAERGDTDQLREEEEPLGSLGTATCVSACYSYICVRMLLIHMSPYCYCACPRTTKC
jgi:hypothetical protein